MSFSCFRVGKRKKGDFNILFNTKHEKTQNEPRRVPKSHYIDFLWVKLLCIKILRVTFL